MALTSLVVRTATWAVLNPCNAKVLIWAKSLVSMAVICRVVNAATCAEVRLATCKVVKAANWAVLRAATWAVVMALTVVEVSFEMSAFSNATTCRVVIAAT